MIHRRLMSALAFATALAGVAPAQTPQIPRKAPELVVRLPGGKDLFLSSLRGKVVAIEFLFTTCPHCKEASRVMSRLYTEYGPRGLEPVGVAFNDMAMLLVPEFVSETNANYPVGVSPREPVLNFLEYTENTRMMVPAMVFIDRQGMVRNQTPLDPVPDFHSEANLRKIVEALLNEKAPTPARHGSQVKRGAPVKKVAKQ